MIALILSMKFSFYIDPITMSELEATSIYVSEPREPQLETNRAALIHDVLF